MSEVEVLALILAAMILGGGGASDAEDTLFWENAGLLLSVIQFILYVIGFKKYRDILHKIADLSEEHADERLKAYESLRNRDKEFFEYYCNLPLYNECESNIRRSKGASYLKYGTKLRRLYNSVNGYSRMSRVRMTQHFSREAIAESAQRRVMQKIEERSLVDDHIIQRWDAIISSPTNAAVSVNLSTGIQASFKTLGAFGRGANSAGITIGSILYRKGYI